MILIRMIRVKTNKVTKIIMLISSRKIRSNSNRKMMLENKIKNKTLRAISNNTLRIMMSNKIRNQLPNNTLLTNKRSWIVRRNKSKNSQKVQLRNKISLILIKNHQHKDLLMLHQNNSLLKKNKLMHNGCNVFQMIHLVY